MHVVQPEIYIVRKNYLPRAMFVVTFIVRTKQILMITQKGYLCKSASHTIVKNPQGPFSFTPHISAQPFMPRSNEPNLTPRRMTGPSGKLIYGSRARSTNLSIWLNICCIFSIINTSCLIHFNHKIFLIWHYQIMLKHYLFFQ